MTNYIINNEKYKVCGDLVYGYQYYGDVKEKDYEFLDLTGFNTHSASFYASNSQQCLKIQYRKYLLQRDQIIRDNLIRCKSYGLPLCLADVFLLTPSMFGIISNTEEQLSASRRRLRDLIFTNFGINAHLYTFPLFLTLTYRIPQFSPSQAKADLSLFVKRLRYRLGINFRYIAIPEKHQSNKTSFDRYGSFHYHILLFDVDFLHANDLTDCWGKGFCYVKRCYGDSFRVAYYVTKYLTKDLSIETGRRYLASFNCLKPTIIESDSLSTVPTLAFVSSSTYTLLSGQIMRLSINKIKY